MKSIYGLWILEYIESEIINTCLIMTTTNNILKPDLLPTSAIKTNNLNQ